MSPALAKVGKGVLSVDTSDKTPLPTFAKTGDKRTYTGCAVASGAVPIEATGADGEVCREQNAYVRNGRMSIELNCNRKGKGSVNASFDGKYDAAGFSGTLTSSSSFPGPGDYKMVEEITARKVADQCSAVPAKKRA